MRIENSGNVYFSLQEFASAYGVKPVKKKDEVKLNSQREKFNAKHLCYACKQPLTWTGGNVLTCLNPSCKGIKRTKKNDDGTETVFYTTSYELLDEKSESFANYLFD